jgi:copper chaperone CopZ
MPEKDFLRLSIEGMHCGGCVNRVTNALSKLQGLSIDQVEVGSARVHYDPAVLNPAQIVDSIDKIGFKARAFE